MSATRALRALSVAAGIVIGLAACGSTATTGNVGVLTGTVDRCLVHVGHDMVRVYNDIHLVARQSVRSGQNYRFTLPGGRYFVTTDPLVYERSVVLPNGGTVHVNISASCP